MLKILTIIGARPQIIKAAALSRLIQGPYASKVEEFILHTGQHYDDNMSSVFFEELGIPLPQSKLSVNKLAHGAQTAIMLTGIEKTIQTYHPHCLVIYGDTNSTLAGALAAAKLRVPVVHIEAGLRSYNKAMPEEVNRIASDHVSTLMFSPTETGIFNLEKEGFNKDNKPPYTINNPGIYHCGDVMFDNSLYFEKLAGDKSTKVKELGLKKNFILATVHRNNNTDDANRLNQIFKAFLTLAKQRNTIVFPLHPRTKKMLTVGLKATLFEQVQEHELIKIIEPVSFLDMIALEKHCDLIITDSGGVQKEAFFFKKPCVIMRSETEWIELVNNGNAVLADANENKIVEAVTTLRSKTGFSHPSFYGDGKAANFILDEILKQIPH